MPKNIMLHKEILTDNKSIVIFWTVRLDEGKTLIFAKIHVISLTYSQLILL